MKVKYLGHYNSAPFCAVQRVLWHGHTTLWRWRKGMCFQALRAWSTLFRFPVKWLLRVKLRGETGLMNGFCLPLYYFLLFLRRSQLDHDLLKGKVECHRTENQLPIAVRRQPSVWLSYSDFYHVLASGAWLSNKYIASLYSTGTGPFAKEAMWVVI